MVYTPPKYVGPVAHSSGNGNLPLNRIVIHCTAGADAKGATGTARYFQDPNATGSAHYVVDPNATVQCAYDAVVCWHAPPNTHSLGIEICCSLANDGKGHWQLASHVTMMQHTATLVAVKCIEHKVPAVKLSVADLLAGKHGICGHVDVSNAFHQSTHTDPGHYFPWSQFMAMVQSEIAKLTSNTSPSEDNEMLTPEAITQVRAGVQAELEEYGVRNEVAPTGTLTQFMAEVRAELKAIATDVAALKAAAPKA